MLDSTSPVRSSLGKHLLTQRTLCALRENETVVLGEVRGRDYTPGTVYKCTYILCVLS